MSLSRLQVEAAQHSATCKLGVCLRLRVFLPQYGVEMRLIPRQRCVSVCLANENVCLKHMKMYPLEQLLFDFYYFAGIGFVQLWQANHWDMIASGRPTPHCWSGTKLRGDNQASTLSYSSSQFGWKMPHPLVVCLERERARDPNKAMSHEWIISHRRRADCAPAGSKYIPLLFFFFFFFPSVRG